MSSSPEQQLATLRIAAPPFVEVSVVDDDLRAVPVPASDAGGGEITLRVPAGTYDVTFRAADARHTVLAWVEAGRDAKVELPEPLRFSTPAPYEATSSTREYQREPAAQLSREPALGSGDAALLVFVRNPTAVQGTTSALRSVDLSVDGVDLAGAREDTHAHWAGLHVARDPGCARLALAIGDRRYEQSLELVAGYQTQVFVVVGERGIEPGCVSIAICERSRGFDPRSSIQLQTALAMRALELGRWERGLDRSVLLGGIDESPLLAIFGAHLLVQGDVQERDVPIVIDVAQQLAAKLGPRPDVVAIRLALRLKLGADPLAHLGAIAPLDRPPMLYKSWKRWVQASQDDRDLIPEASVGDGLAFVATSTGPWLTWAAGALERPMRRRSRFRGHSLEALADSAEGLGATPEERADRIYRQLRLPRATAEREAAPLIAQLLRSDSAREESARLVELETIEALLTLAESARRVGSPEAARAALERAYRDRREAGNAAGATRLRDALRAIYEATGAWSELAQFVLEDAEQLEGDAQFEVFKRAGDLLVNQVGDAPRALAPLQAAAAAKPDDLEVTGLLVDAMIGSDQLAEAVEILQASIGAKGRRRSPGLAGLQLRMGRIAGLSGDPAAQLDWLKVALDTDKGNGAIAAELAELAIQLGDDIAALNALKVLTLQKTPGPMSKAMAFLRQAQIAHRQGDQQKAVLWARRARMEDAELAEAEQFLGELGEG